MEIAQMSLIQASPNVSNVRLGLAILASHTHAWMSLNIFISRSAIQHNLTQAYAEETTDVLNHTRKAIPTKKTRPSSNADPFQVCFSSMKISNTRTPINQAACAHLGAHPIRGAEIRGLKAPKTAKTDGRHSEDVGHPLESMTELSIAY